MSGFVPDVVKAKVAASLLFHLIDYPIEVDSLSTMGISKVCKVKIKKYNISCYFRILKEILS